MKDRSSDECGSQESNRTNPFVRRHVPCNRIAAASTKNIAAVLRRVMKRIELVIEPSALDRFTEAARAMSLSDFDVMEVRGFPSKDRQEQQDIYYGQSLVPALQE